MFLPLWYLAQWVVEPVLFAFLYAPSLLRMVIHQINKVIFSCRTTIYQMLLCSFDESFDLEQFSISCCDVTESFLESKLYTEAKHEICTHLSGFT